MGGEAKGGIEVGICFVDNEPAAAPGELCSGREQGRWFKALPVGIVRVADDDGINLIGKLQGMG